MNKLGYGVNNPINVNKNKRILIVSIITIFLLLVCGLFVHFAILEPNNVGMSSTLDCVYADSYDNPDTWVAKSWQGLTNFNGAFVWSDGVNYYYSNGSTQQVLDVSTSTWSTKTWNGLTNFNGTNVWSDGVNYYYSNGSTQYVLDVSTSTWSTKIWNGVSPLGESIWSDGVNYYYSQSVNQFVLDVSTSTWSTKTWQGFSYPNGSQIWSDGVNYYYSNGADQYVLDISTSTWSIKTWNGLISFLGSYVWSDGVNYYYSNASGQYILDVSTSTWSTKTWQGLINFYGNNIYGIFYIDNTVYYSYQFQHYELVKDYISSVPAFTVTQDKLCFVLDFEDDLDLQNYYSDLRLDIYLCDSTFANKTLYAQFSASDLSTYNANGFEYGFLGSLPHRYISFDMVNVTDLTNHYSVDFTYNSFVYSSTDIYDRYSTVDGSHLGFYPVSYNFASQGVTYNYLLCNHFNISLILDTINLLTFDVYDTNSFFDAYYACCGSWVNNVGTLHNYISTADLLYDGYFSRDVSYRGQFSFVDKNCNFFIAGFYQNNVIYDSSLVLNYFDFIENLGMSTSMPFSNWFNVPYNLDAPIVTFIRPNNLVWSSVQGADYYNIYLDGNEIATHLIGTNYLINDVGDYTVQAVSNLPGVVSSISADYTVAPLQLDSPVVTLTYANIDWDDIEYADYYVLYMYDSSNNSWSIYASNIRISFYTLTVSGKYCVRAVSNLNNLYPASSLSNSIDFVGAWSPGGGNNDLGSLIGAVVDVPVHYVVSLFDFDMDFLGFNMLNLILSIFTLCILIWIFKFVLGRRG